MTTRLEGRVLAGGEGVAGAAVTDGEAVAVTDAEGRFAFPSRAGRFASVCLPAGYAASGGLPWARVGTAPVRFDLTPRDGDGARHAFVVLADPQPATPAQLGEFEATTVPAVAEAAAAMPGETFGIGLGDLVGDAPELLGGYARAVARTGIPFFHAVGNHDGSPRDRTGPFHRHFGPSTYSFDRGEVHYVVLDNVSWLCGFYRGRLGSARLAWLRRDLRHVEPGRTVVVFGHIPLVGTWHRRHGKGAPGRWHCTADRDALCALLEPFRAHFIAGHMHEHEHNSVGAVREHVVGTASGYFWDGPVNLDGTPRGFAVYDVRGSELRWRYAATDGSGPLRLHAPGSAPEAPGSAVANVWDWDEDWALRWWEDGRPRGEPRRFLGLAPAWRRRFGAAGPAPGSEDDHRTDHLFAMELSPGARHLRLEATDPWGGVHAAELAL